MRGMKTEMDDVEPVRRDSIKKSKVLTDTILTTSKTNCSVSKDLTVIKREDREFCNERGQCQGGGSEDISIRTQITHH